MFISINGAYPITAPHQAPWLDVVGNTRTDPSQYVSDIAFMAQGNAVPVGEPPDYDASTSVLIWENGWMVRPKTVDELTADRTAACVRLSAGVTAWLDSVAADRQYDGIHALVGYATSSNTAWKAEAQAGIAWRDGVWSALPAIQAEIMDGTRPVPTLEALKAELPQIAWPS